MPVAPVPVEPEGVSAPPLAGVLLEVVAEKTGYPTDLLDLSMSLDSDLGIDSIKRVEIVSAMAQRVPEAAAVSSEELGAIRTLGDVVTLLAGGAEPGAPAGPVPVEPEGVSAPPLAGVLLEVVAEKTGYPTDLLDLSMSLDSDLGIDSIKRVEIVSAMAQRVPEAAAVSSEELGAIRTLGDVVTLLAGGSAPVATVPADPLPPAPVVAPNDGPAGLQASRVEPVTWHPPGNGARHAGRVVVVGLGGEWPQAIAAALRDRGFDADVGPFGAADNGEIDGMVLVGSPQPDDAEVQAWFAETRSAAAALRARRGFLWTVARLDGSFGWTGLDGELEPMSGALAGLAKTAAVEWPEVSVVALDVAADAEPTRAADVVDGALASGPVERGFSADGRWTTARLQPVDVSAQAATALGDDDVVVVTGGARGVTAAATLALVRAGGERPHVVLLGRSAEPGDADPSWALGVDGADRLRAAAIATGRWQSPAEIEQQVRALLAEREVRGVLAKLRAAGADVTYRAVDVRDAAAVDDALADVHRRIGPVTAVIHGAGVLADRLIEDKTDAQFAVVFDTKVAGLRNLLDSLDRTGDALRLLVLFSSSTARFGRRGQVDYAMANEVLNKTAGRVRRTRPNCRALAVNWGPWRGGMVTDALAGVFAEEGINLIDVDEGAAWLAKAVATADGPEVVVLAGPTQPPPAEPTDGLSLAFGHEIDIESHPVLRSHVIDGRAVLPAAMMLEWLAHGGVHTQPGLALLGVDEFRVLKGLVLGANETRRIQVWTGRAHTVDGITAVPVELTSVTGSSAEQSTALHARGTVLLGHEPAEAPLPVIGDPPGGRALPFEEIYPQRLFHGPDLQSIAEVTGCAQAGISATMLERAPSPADWISEPLRGRWLTDPLAVDTGFQLMTLWSLEQTGHSSLPSFVGRYRQFAAHPAGRTIAIHAHVTDVGEHHARADIEFVDSSGAVVAAIGDYECTISLRHAFQRTELIAEH